MADAATADLAALAADFAYASQQGIFTAAQQVIQQAAQQVQAEAQSRAPVKTGKLRDSIRIRYVDALKAIVGPNVEYGVYQEFGTGLRGEFPGKMYEIKPKNASVLVFTVGGKKRYARVVHHPGIKAHPYMRPAIAATLGADLAGKMAEAGALLITKGPKA